MPLIYYICDCKESLSRFYRISKDIPSKIPCSCGLEMKRQLSGPSNASKIVIDNGIQAKSVEVDLEVIESNLENSDRNFREK